MTPCQCTSHLPPPFSADCKSILHLYLTLSYLRNAFSQFNKSASFQLAACLLVLIVALCVHLRALPYMSPGSHDDVLRSHKASIFSSAAPARLDVCD